MPAPIASQLTPADLDTFADIDRVSLVWTAADLLDPLDVTEFTIARGATLYPVTYQALGAGTYKVSADVGLFPGDKSVNITATAKTVAAVSGSASWSFDCRGGEGAGAPLDLPSHSVALAAMLAELPNINPLVAGGIARASHTPAGTFGLAIHAAIFVEQLVAAADAAPAHFVAAKSFLILLGLATLTAGAFESLAGLESSTADQGRVPSQDTLSSLTAELGLFAKPGQQSLEAGKPTTVSIEATLTAGKKTSAAGLESADVQGGSGEVAIFDACDDALDAARE